MTNHRYSMHITVPSVSVELTTCTYGLWFGSAEPMPQASYMDIKEQSNMVMKSKDTKGY